MTTPLPPAEPSAERIDLPELPSPSIVYADHSYPAFSKKQMQEYALAALAPAHKSGVDDVLPATKLRRMADFLDGEQGRTGEQWLELLSYPVGRTAFGKWCSQDPKFHDKLWSEMSDDIRDFWARREILFIKTGGLETRPAASAPAAEASDVVKAALADARHYVKAIDNSDDAHRDAAGQTVELIDQALRLLARAGSGAGVVVPKGWQLVPVEPIQAMMAATAFVRDSHFQIENTWKTWDAMLAAAPPPPVNAAVPAPDPATLYARRVTLPYTNWRGEHAMREIAPIKLFWGSNEWHREPQWLLEVWDIAKSEIRAFALSGFGPPPTSPEQRS